MSTPAYDHTQSGSTILISLVGAAAIVAVSLTLATRATGGVRAMPTPALLAVGLTFVILVASAIVFSKLNVRVADGAVSWRFGLGFQEHTIPLTEIVSATVVTNPVWAGYGVRRMPNGWLYNVAGRRAVELVLRDGRRVRVGSDEPETLERAITVAR